MESYFQYSPVLTTVGSTALPLSKVDYPAITICSQGKHAYPRLSNSLYEVPYALKKNSELYTTCHHSLKNSTKQSMYLISNKNFVTVYNSCRFLVLLLSGYFALYHS